MSKETSVLGLFQKLFHNFNARQMKDATLAFKKHLDDGGRMLLAMAGAMSSAQLGVTLAPDCWSKIDRTNTTERIICP